MDRPRFAFYVLLVGLFLVVGCTDAPAALQDPLSELTGSAPPIGAPLPDPSIEPRRFTIMSETSQASYSVREELFGQNVGSRVTVGFTSEVEGSIALRIDPENGGVALGENLITVNLGSLTSNEARRDDRIRTEWLQSDTYPLATFAGSEIVGFPAGAREGEEVTFQIIGDLTIRDVTKPVTFTTVATLDGQQLSGTATALVYMRDFGFEPPSVMGVLAVTDGVTVTLQFEMQEE